MVVKTQTTTSDGVPGAKQPSVADTRIPPCRLHIQMYGGVRRPPEGTHEINVVRGGPEQLLGWLETQLGLNGPRTAWTDRVVQYHDCIKRHGSGLWAPSFKADPWATASHQLKRRDELLLGGWKPGGAGNPAITAEFERLEQVGMLPGIPDRILLVVAALELGLKVPAHTITLEEPTEAWRPLWRRLLGRLTVAHQAPTPPRGAGSLAIIQQNLRNDAANACPIDASVIALQAASRHAAVQFVARWMRDRPRVVVHAGHPEVANLLDVALAADGQPTMGVTRESRAQPAHQVLPLAMQLLWNPVNPYVLLDLLVLPVGPLRSVGYELARALEKQPGYQSAAWSAAIKTIAGEEDGEKKAAKIAVWLDHDRIALGEDAPTRLVESRCGLVAQWASGRAAWERLQEQPDEDLIAALQSASSQASALGRIAAQLGTHISEAQLDRLLDEVRRDSSSDVPHDSQAGGATYAASLAHVSDCDHLVWLAPIAPVSNRPHWTPSEARHLRQAAIDVDDHSAALRAAEARGLARPKNLLVIDLAAIEESRHPLWLRVHGDLVVNKRRGGPLPQLEAALQAGRVGLPTRAVERAPAPGVRVEWSLAGHKVPLPKHTSATALEDQLACPLKWTLKYALGVRPSAIANIPEDGRLKGNFAHDLLRHILPAGPVPAPEEAAQRLDACFDELLERNAAPLAIPRKLTERNTLKRELRAAVKQLCTVLREGEYEIAGLEVPTEGAVNGLPLRGSIDCVVRRTDGEAIIDFKLGGAQAHAEKLTSGRALQLATYAHSRQEGAQIVTGGAYFILGDNRMLTPKGGALRGVERPIDGPAITETWKRFEQALTEASTWMNSGVIVARPLQDPAQWAPGSQLALDPEAQEHAACKYCDYATLCGRRQLA